MNYHQSDESPSRRNPDQKRARSRSDSFSIFERSVPREWLLEGEAGPDGETNHVLINSTPFRVGRRSINNLTISNRTVSGQHAEIIVDKGQLLLRDHKSTNGTFVNGKRVESIIPVDEGDVIHFGKVRYSVLRVKETLSRATLAFDAEGDAVAHLQFASLWDGDGLTPHFQPIVRLDNQQVVAYESLARSELPGLENPYNLFQIAKQHKAESELSSLLRQVSLERSLPFLGEATTLYLNTHPKELGDNELFESLEELREEFPTASIVIEVHEAGNVSIQFLEELKQKLTELDMKLAYDDFGVGQSRLNALAEVTPDIVKFDMELVRNLHKTSAKRRRLIRSLLKIVKALNGVTLAEGVEHEAEAEACLDLGFELAQGYYFGKPALPKHWYELSQAGQEAPQLQ